MNRFLLAISFVLGLGANAYALTADEEPTVPTLAIGSAAPNFKLPGVDGKTHELKEFASAKILALIFTCDHCPTAQGYEDRIKKLVEDYKGKSVAFVAISPNDPASVRPDEMGYTEVGDSLEEMKIRAAYRKFNLPYLFGGGEFEPISKAFGPVATPHTFIFDSARKLRYVGRIDDSEREANVVTKDVRNALDALLAGKPVPVAQTKVFGCSVKWSDKRASVKQYWDKIGTEPITLAPADAKVLKALRENKADGTPEQGGDGGKVRLVTFWATWCGPCVTEFDDIAAMYRNYRHRDFELVTVSAQFDDEKDEVLAFLKKHKATNRNFIFGDKDKYKLIEAFGGGWDGALPFTALIDPTGKVLWKHQGEIDPIALRRVILPTIDIYKPWANRGRRKK